MNPSTIINPKAAAKLAGILIRKLILKASSPVKFLKSNIEVVNPDRDNPGIIANPCTAPRIIDIGHVNSDLFVHFSKLASGAALL